MRVDCEVVHHPGQEVARRVEPADHHRDGVGGEELLVVAILFDEGGIKRS